MKRKSISILAVAVVYLGLSGCGATKKTTNPLVGGELLLDISAKEMKAKLLEAQWPIAGYDVYGYRAYKIPYTTHDDEGVLVHVSGLFVLPTGVDSTVADEGFSLVSDAHGTIVHNDSAPTAMTQKYQQPNASTIIFSSLGGFVTLQADYIGYGDSVEHYHPYMLKNSSAETSVDFITAAKKFAHDNHIKLNDKLFVTGYSEGGYTAMATTQKLEALGISVTASAPLAGSYDLEESAFVSLGMRDENLTGFSAAYYALTTLVYTKIYDHNLSSIIRLPYASQIEELLDGGHTFTQIKEALPSSAGGENGLLIDNFIQEVKQNEQHWFRIALRENSVSDWSPQTPMHIVHCQGDDQTSFAAAQQSYETMRDNGAFDITFVIPDIQEPADAKWDHGECYFPAIKHTALWFVQMRDR